MSPIMINTNHHTNPPNSSANTNTHKETIVFKEANDNPNPPDFWLPFHSKKSDNKEEMARVLPATEYNRLPNYDSERGLRLSES